VTLHAGLPPAAGPGPRGGAGAACRAFFVWI